MRTLWKESEEIAILGIATEQDLRLTKFIVHNDIVKNDKGHSAEWQSLSTQTDGLSTMFRLEPSRTVVEKQTSVEKQTEWH